VQYFLVLVDSGQIVSVIHGNPSPLA
jgi:hypothetical protein